MENSRISALDDNVYQNVTVKYIDINGVATKVHPFQVSQGRFACIEAKCHTIDPQFFHSIRTPEQCKKLYTDISRHLTVCYTRFMASGYQDGNDDVELE